MKFKTTTRELKKHISAVSRAVDMKPTTPALQGIYMKALGEFCEFVGSDLDLVLVHEDGFKIVTMAGNVITPTEIRVSDSYHVKVFGKSIDKSDTFDKLKAYYDRLKSSGVLAQ